jgi:molybdopterin-guanine dinucleotide biosynthesis protein A
MPTDLHILVEPRALQSENEFVNMIVAGICRSEITGLVLAGGRGNRMGGLDKGLQPWQGVTLAANALARLAPQVGRCLISANRHLDHYRALGVPVCTDSNSRPGLESDSRAAAVVARCPASVDRFSDAFAGPLAGMLAGLRACETDWLACVPCDVPAFPADLVDRLARAVESRRALLAFAASSSALVDSPDHESAWRAHPVFCLIRRGLVDDLADHLDRGDKRVLGWLTRHAHAVVRFDEPSRFENLNTLSDLAQAGPSR